MSRVRAEDGLTEKQAAFVREYLIDLNATAAAGRAGYGTKNANKVGPELLTKPFVAAAIQREMGARAERTLVTADRVIAEFARLAFADMGKFMKIEGGEARVDFQALEGGDTACISEITQDEYVEGRGEDAREVKKTKIKLHDKMGALQALAKHLGLFTDRVELTGRDGGPINVQGGVSSLLRAAQQLDAVKPRLIAPDADETAAE